MTVGKTYWCNITGGVSCYTDTGRKQNGYPVFHCQQYHFMYGDSVTIVQKVYGYSEDMLDGSTYLFYKTNTGVYIWSLLEEWFTETKPGIEM